MKAPNPSETLPLTRQIQEELGQLFPPIPAGTTFRVRLGAIFLWLSRAALAGTVVLIPFRYRLVLAARPVPPVYKDFTDLLLFGSELFLFATLGFWALHLAMQPRRLIIGPLVLSAPIIGLTFMSSLSVIFSIDPALSSSHALRLWILGGFYLYLVNEIPTIKMMLVPLAFQVYIQALVGILQILRQASLGLGALGELRLDPAWSGVSIVWAEGVRSLRAYGLSDHPNILGGCFALALLLLAGGVLRSSPRNRIVLSGVFSIGAVGLLLTFSRAAWLAFGAGLAILSIYLVQATRRTRLSTWIALLIAGALFALPFLWHNAPYLGVRLNQDGAFRQAQAENRSISERRALNLAANQIFARQPLTGVGLGTSPQALLHFNPQFRFDYQPPHVVLLAVAEETGLFGAAFYFLAVVGPWLAIWVNRHRLRFSIEFMSISSALLAITVIGLFDYYPWMLTPGRLWLWLVWGLWGAVYQASLAGGARA